MSMNIEMYSGNSATWSLQMLNNGAVVEEHEIKTYFGNTTVSCSSWTIYNEGDNNLFYNFTDCITGNSIYRKKIPIGGQRVECSRDEPVIEEGIGTVAPTIPTPPTCGTYTEPGTLDQTLTFVIDRGYTNNNFYNATSGNKLSFRLKLVGITDLPGYIASLNSGGLLSVGSLATSTGYSVIGCSPSYMSITGSSSILFNPALSSFYNQNYMFVPNPASGSTSALYDEYGDVDYVFTPKPNDIVIVYLSDKSIVEYNITDVTVSSTGRLTLDLDSPLSNLAKTNLTSSVLPYDRFLLLSRRPDETNVILNFTKRDGKTSYGFLISDIISSEVLSNIDTITKEVKQKLLNDQPIINDINGGTFGP